jgi:surface protein
MNKIEALNDIVTGLGGTGGYKYEIQALNAWAVLVGDAGGYKYEIQALNAIDKAKGGTGLHKYNIDALNSICKAAGGSGVNKYEIAALVFIGSNVNPKDPDFIITFDTTKPGSASNTVVFPLISKTANDVVIKWGDGSEDSYSTVGNKTHVYAAPGTYEVRVNKEMTAFSFNDTGDKLKAIFHDNWGSSEFTRMYGAFYGCTNIQYRALDFPNTSQVTSMAYMFFNTPFNQSVTNFDTSKVTNMVYMFYNTSFNQSVTNFDTSKVTNMASMFRNTSFNQSVTNFDTSQVTSMANMFHSAPFNQSVTNFDTSKVTDMGSMFRETPFNQSVSNFDTSKVTNMAYMFYNTPFKHPINFNIPLVTLLLAMFGGADINEAGTTTNYDLTLNNFANNPNTPNDLTFNGGNSKYSAAGKIGRDILIGKGWTIIDGGLV